MTPRHPFLPAALLAGCVVTVGAHPAAATVFASSVAAPPPAMTRRSPTPLIASPGAPTPAVDHVADTVLVRSSGPAPTYWVDTVRVLWWSDRIDRPVSMAALDGKLVVGDHTRIHLVPTDGAPPRTVGRDGDGPGEYRSITSVGTMGDSILVLDSRARRLSVLSPDGDFARSLPVAPSPPYVNASTKGEPLVMADGHILWMSHELVHTDRPGKEALVSFDPTSRRERVERTWDGVRWTDAGRALAPAGLFDYGTLVAIGLDGEIASGTGGEYCVWVDNRKGDHVLRICRDQKRVRVGREIRSPDLDLAPNPLMRDMLAASPRVQRIPKLMPSYDRLWWSQDGRLWVRTMGEEMAHVHPWLLWDRPELGPSTRRWDVFDDKGALTETVLIPSSLDPRVMTSDHVYGFLQLPTGEIAIGDANLDSTQR